MNPDRRWLWVAGAVTGLFLGLASACPLWEVPLESRPRTSLGGGLSSSDPRVFKGPLWEAVARTNDLTARYGPDPCWDSVLDNAWQGTMTLVFGGLLGLGCGWGWLRATT